jgi:regulator of extracellular matrix RemA (YlzA/DUF370 family)
MAYMLPLRYVLLSEKRNKDDMRCDFAVCATRIVGIMSMDAYQARETVKRERRAGTLINAAGREAALSAVFLDSGAVVASPLSVKKIMRNIEKSNAKELKARQASEIRRMKVYDVVDEEPDQEDTEYEEISTDYTDGEQVEENEFEEFY